ncbi:MAG: ribonuclease HIII [Gilvibacter sp.]
MELSNREILNQIFESQKRSLEAAGLTLSNFKEIDYGVQFNIVHGSWKGLMRIYRNKKGAVKYDYSPIKDESKIAILRSILEPQDNDRQSRESKSFTPNESDLIPVDFKPIIGTDESGKGDYFGPLVAAGVYVDQKTKLLLDRNGVRDSKKISDAKILKLAQMIKIVCRGQYAVIEITPGTYNNLYSTFKTEGKNLNTLLAWGHAKAIEEVLLKVKCDYAISDKFADERFILSKLQEKGRGINLIQEHKAESYTAVAAASILARARFLERMKKMSGEYKIDFAKGANPRVVDQAKVFVLEHGKEELSKVAKMHFKTTEQVLT